MLGTFGVVKSYFKFKPKEVNIDNLAFRLHYKWTFAIFIICTILVTSRQYIGEHIRCITGGSIPDHVINTFCFFTTTFTLIRHLNESALAQGGVIHPGVGPLLYDEDPVKRHAYYQWVPFVLFGQGLLFYFPHVIWKKFEEKRIYALVNGLKMVSLSKYMKSQDLNIGGRNYYCQDTTDCRVKVIKTAFMARLKINENWGKYLVTCEFLNLLNVLFQIYFTNVFLGGQFYNLGFDIMTEDWLGQMDTLDVIFPKVTKCHFYKFGPSGSLQILDALCIMALNVINEKIYTFLWFWFFILFFISVLAILWRFITLCLHRRSSPFNANLFSYASPGRLNHHDIDLVTENCTFSNWLFLYYLAANMDPALFRNFLGQLAQEFDTTDHYSETEDNEANHQSECDDDGRSSHTSLSNIDRVDHAKLRHYNEKIK